MLRRVRLQAIIAVLVLVPSLIASVAALLLAQQAGEKRAQADRAQHDLELLVTVRNLESATFGEAAFYSGWLRMEPDGDFDPTDPILITMRGAVAATSLERTDAALERMELLRDELSTIDQVHLNHLSGAVDDVRAAFKEMDRAKAETAVDAVDMANRALRPLGDAVLTRQGGEWLLVDKMSVAMHALALEVAYSGPLLLSGSAGADERRQAGRLADVTDFTFDDMVAFSGPADQTELLTARHDLSEIHALRSELASFGERPTPVEPAELAGMVVSVQDFSDVIARQQEEVGSALDSKASTEAKQARQYRDSLFLLIAGMVVIPTLLVLRVSSALSRRLGQLTSAANQVSLGTFHLDPLDDDGDEFGVLATAFNHMIETISTTHDQVIAISEGTLDDPVLDAELPGAIGETMRAALRRLGSTTEALTHRASHDQLTGLLDRAGLMARVQTIPPDEHSVVALIDLDRFKAVNDTYGHAAGDQVLVAVARRLERLTRNVDILARLGGDELLVILRAVDATASIPSLMSRIIEQIEQPIDYTGITLNISASVGWTALDADESFDDALARADRAMYVAKDQGRGRLVRA